MLFMNKIYVNVFKQMINNNCTYKSFCSISNFAEKSSKSPPIRISFQQENLQHLPHVFSLTNNKRQLDKNHQQFLKLLTSNIAKGKQQFEHFENSNKNLYSYIKSDILTGQGFYSNSEFIKRSHYYFQSQGKKIRPTMVKMLADSFDKKSPQIAQKVQKWGALIEMMHISSLAHDDIIDDSPSRRGVESQHLKYGKRSAVFSANFIIAKASKSIFEFDSSKLYQIYSLAMDNLATGQIIQAITKNSINNNQKKLRSYIETYLQKSYYKTAALMANSMRGVPVFFDNVTPQQEIASFRIGQHFGIAFQLVDDIMDYTSTAEAMGKENLADIREGNVTGPVYFSLLAEEKEVKTSSFMMNQLREKNKTKDQAEQIKKWVFANPGIELTFALADLHIKKGLSYLKLFPKNNEEAWKYLGYKILTRNK